MDILVISNIINKFSKIIFDNNKSECDIKYLNEFLEDPFNLNIEFLNTFYMQHGSGLKKTIAKQVAKSQGASPKEVAAIGKIADKTSFSNAAAAGKAAMSGNTSKAEALSEKAGVNPGEFGVGGKQGIPGGMPSPPTGAEASKQVQELSGADADQMKEMAGKMGGPGGEALKNMADAGSDEKELKLVKLLRLMIKAIIYPLIFIFLAIFPYIYVTYASFKKLLKSYRKNVRTV
jgi:hypothetical protein